MAVRWAPFDPNSRPMAKFSGMAVPKAPWKLVSHLVEVRNQWMALVGERLLDSEGNEIDYWRVENTDSLIVIVVSRGELVLPVPAFRPGVGRATLDFCGGRLLDPADLDGEAKRIVARELGIDHPDPFEKLERVNTTGWETNSSFESQRVFGAVATLRAGLNIDPSLVGASYAPDDAGVAVLLDRLTCLQCRGVLAEAIRLGIVPARD